MKRNRFHSFLAQGLFVTILVLALFTLSHAAGPSAPDRQALACGATTTGPYVRLLGWEFDPLCQPEPLYLPSTLRLEDYAQGQAGYYLVQFQGPILPEWKDAVGRTGAVLLDYLPDFTFIARMDPATRDRVAALPMVRWTGVYQPGYRLSPDLLGQVLGAADVSSATQDLHIVAFPGESLAAVESQVAVAGGSVLEATSNSMGTTLKVRVDLSRAGALASINGVRWVEPFYERKLTNDVARGNAIMAAETVWSGLNLYGAGQIVAVSDTGLDTGSLGTLAQDFLGTPTGCSGTSRIIATFARGTTGDWSDSCRCSSSGWVNEGGHGTHVIGSILGNGCRSGSTGNPTYSGSYAGLAPQAGLVLQSVMGLRGGVACTSGGCGLTGIPSDLNTLFSEARGAGARIHSNSWGSSVRGQYTTDSYNTDLYTWNNKDYTILFSAGNSGADDDNNGVVDLDSLGAPGTAKNCITVGGSENYRLTGGINPGATVCSGNPGACSPPNAAKYGNCWPTDYQASPVCPDLVSNNSAGMVAFSSRGPTNDDRTKPDVVAPGTNILSTKSQGQYVSSGWGAGPNGYYQYMGGTSMSTPLTAGAVALIRDFYNDTKGVTTPSSALLKATLVNGATDIYPGQYGSGGAQEIATTRPNNIEGWGRVDLADSLLPASPRALDFFDFGEGIQTNEWDTIVYNMSTTGQVFRTTLAWTDYPGTLASGGGLVNDLDFDVTDPASTVVYPNNANRRGASQYLIYDNDASNAYASSTSYRYAVKFTPTSYPVNVRRGLFYNYATSYPDQYTLYVYDDNGTGGQPGTILFTSSLTRVGDQRWSAVNITGVTISSGSFYVAIRPNAANAPAYTTDSGPSSGNNWYYNGSIWTLGCPAGSYNFNIRAIVSANDYSTSYDRVNNLVGIDINSPAQTGNYTVKVAGYNVPQGPQPYAMVTTGATSFSGASSYRLFAGGDTAQRTFGRTGVKMDFSSGPAGNVTVTMAKAAPAQSPPGGITFLNVNWNITSAMTGFSTQVVFSYDHSDIPGGMNENQIGGAYRYNGTSWGFVGGTVDTTANTVTVSGMGTFSYWALGNSPTAVRLLSFAAAPAADGILLTWETAGEHDNVGFHLYRSVSLDSPGERLNQALIPAAAPGGDQGASYTFLDATALPGMSYYYTLEDVDVNGARTPHGPALFTLWRAYLPLVGR